MGADKLSLYVKINKKLHQFDLNIDFQAGNDTLGLLGISGSGKSMTLACIAGLEKPDSGYIELNGRVLYDSSRGIDLPSRDRRVGYVFQNYALFPHMTVEQNIGFGLNNTDKWERKEKIKKLIDMMHLQGFEKRYPNQLSGGQQQRTALARVLAVNPEVILLDEPFSALDVQLREQMICRLKVLLSEYGGTALFVTHNMDEVYNICSKIIILSNGHIEALDDREKVFNSPSSLAAAQVTGCKNIFAIEKINKGTVKLKGWGQEITVNIAAEYAKYICIRSHQVELWKGYSGENLLECIPVSVDEAPFNVMVTLKLKDVEALSEDTILHWDMSREQWAEISNIKLPWKIWLDPAKINVF